MVLSIADFFRKMHRREEGFTLIELLIVIAILAVLAAIAIPLVVNRISEARIAADDANVAQLQSAVDLYNLDLADGVKITTPLTAGESNTEGTNGFINELVTAGYLQKPVKHPLGGTYKLEDRATGNQTVSSVPKTQGI